MKLKLTDLLFFLGLFLFFCLFPTDPDLGWQLRCGELFWKGGQFCSENQFSVMLPDYQWVYSGWLYQVMIFPIFKTFGLGGLVVVNGLVMTLAWGVFYLAFKNCRVEKALAIGLVAMVGWGVFSLGIRSQLLGFLYFCLILFLRSKIRGNFKLIFLLPLVMLAWVNSHGSFILGLILLLFLLAELAVNKRERLWKVAAVMIVSLLITVINPFGARVYQEAWQHFGVVDMSKLIAEWVPPAAWVGWLSLLSGGLVMIFLLAGGGRKNVWAALSVLPFMILALKARRQVPFLFILEFYFLLRIVEKKKSFSFWLKRRELRENLFLLLIICLIFVSVFVRLPEVVARAGRTCWDSSLNYPCGAVAFLKAQEGGGSVFNRYEWGGFLIWHLKERKIFVDGRMPAWPTVSGKSPYTIYLETLQNQPGWEETLREHDLEWILISPGTFMDLLLKPDPAKFGWKEVYRDETAVVYRREAP